jgi:tetratricopeptide (TPR) repeat protein
MRETDARGERLRNRAVLAIVVVALGLALAPKLKFDFGLEPAAAPRLDLAAEGLSLPRPVIEPQSTLTGAPPLPESAQARLDLQRAFFAGDFARLDAALLAAHDEYVSGRSDSNLAKAVIDSIIDTKLAGIDRCDAWLQVMPNSYPAHWLCGAVWRSGAQAARGGKFANEVSAGQFALMGERLQRSNALLERAFDLTPKPVEALTVLAANHYLDSSKPQAEAYLQRAETIMPQYPSIHWVRLNYSVPVWGGSEEAVQAALARARQAGLGESDLLDMEDEYVAQPRKLSTPGAARAYWEAAINKHPTHSRLKSLLDDFVRLENWHDALPVANRLIDEYPDDNSAHYLRGRIYKQLGQIDAARADYLMAAALGNDYALQELIMAHIRGGLGLPGKSFGEVTELCRHGVALGSGVGANCIGSMFFEAASVGVPFPNDPVQGYAWHLVGARAGHFNSQFDLGWMLSTGRVPGVEPEAAKKIGTFWLRRAAEQNHQFAKRKLEELGISPSEGLADRLPGGWNLNALFVRVFGWVESVREKLN